MTIYNHIDKILNTPVKPPAETIGYSREKRPIHGAVLGRGKTTISLIGGCHADEPVGPRFLRKLYAYLATLPATHELLKNYRWHLIPHANPDGEAVNKRWTTDKDDTYDIIANLRYAVRELPGDDIEFGYPKGPGQPGLRPENDAVYKYWQTAQTPFHMHASLHGMMVAAGPWFLMERAWTNRSDAMQTLCREEVAKMGYRLHDVDRKGEKGFTRIADGFCTRPDSESMRAYFLKQNNPEMAQKFYPSSMETIRGLGENPLTIVSEMPLFILPDLPEKMDWPCPQWTEWNTRLAGWKARLHQGDESEAGIRAEIEASGLTPMPVTDQMRLQWRFITAAIAQLEQS